jgi:F-type H+-transporting ATPase subunit epsilon
MSVQLTIVTPEGEAFAGSVDSVVLPGSEGDFGVLEGHERFLSPLRLGPLAIDLGGSTRWAAVSHGFADVSGEEVVVLVDRCQLDDQIDAAAVDASRAEAEASLRELSSDAENDVRRRDLEEAVARAHVWLEVAKKG